MRQQRTWGSDLFRAFGFVAAAKMMTDSVVSGGAVSGNGCTARRFWVMETQAGLKATASGSNWCVEHRKLSAQIELLQRNMRGKTYTMVGTRDDPGLMVLSLNTIFDLIEKDNSFDDFKVTCSYLEVYNEVIYDLLEKSSGHLELREDPEQGITVAGVRSIRQKEYPKKVIRGKLALVDLAGSERASETNNGGQKLRDGANINGSLLALANCINALGKQHKKDLAYVPYRNSKLTRILKDGLSGNSQTIMIATLSPADSQYHHTINTLKYPDRAKEIKSFPGSKTSYFFEVARAFVLMKVKAEWFSGTNLKILAVNAHVSDYQKIIDNLQSEFGRLRKELAVKDSQLNAKPTEKAPDDEISWLNTLSQEISENVHERINLQKALIEVEETNLRNRKELQHLDDAIAKQQVVKNYGGVVQALQARRQVILDNICIKCCAFL